MTINENNDTNDPHSQIQEIQVSKLITINENNDTNDPHSQIQEIQVSKVDNNNNVLDIEMIIYPPSS